VDKLNVEFRGGVITNRRRRLDNKRFMGKYS